MAYPASVSYVSKASKIVDINSRWLANWSTCNFLDPWQSSREIQPQPPALPKDQSLTSFGFAYPLEKSLTTTSDGELQNNQREEKAGAEPDGIQLSSSPSPQYDNGKEPKPDDSPDHYMTGKFTTEHYLMDVDGNYGQVKLEIHKQSAEKVSWIRTFPAC